jgi:hypothetical protein
MAAHQMSSNRSSASPRAEAWLNLIGVDAQQKNGSRVAPARKSADLKNAARTMAYPDLRTVLAVASVQQKMASLIEPV